MYGIDDVALSGVNLGVAINELNLNIRMHTVLVPCAARGGPMRNWYGTGPLVYIRMYVPI